MINTIQITNKNNDVLKFEMRSPDSSGFLVRSINGLDPAKANINLIDQATDDGGRFNYSRLNSKNIVFDLVFLPNFSISETIEDLRHKLYKHCPIKQQIKIEFFSDNRSSEIYGYIESNEINIFSRQVSSQISVVCPTPYFKKIEETIVNFNGELSLFEFPFSNESLVSKLIRVSSISNVVLNNILYEGDVETGILIKIHAVGPIEDINIFNESTEESLFIDTSIFLLIVGTTIQAGDDILISTIKGDKRVVLIRNGVYTNILNCLGIDSDWLYFKTGDNILSFTAVSGIENMQLSIEYHALYEGM